VVSVSVYIKETRWTVQGFIEASTHAKDQVAA